MNPGELDQLIDIKREVSTPDGMGGEEITLTDVVTGLWAKVRALSGKELERHDQLNSTAMCAFIIRYRGDLKHTDRIVWNGSTYNIRYIPPATGRAMYLIIEAERGVSL